MSQKFVRCLHCGLPHALEETTCPITGRPLERRSVRPETSQGRAAGAPPSSRGLPAAQAVAPFEPKAATVTASLVGQVLGGKYRALRVLGEGGMGTVYHCEHVTLHRHVAVKVLHPAQAKKSASLARFHHEAHVAGAIGHANICEIYDLGELPDGSPFLVMELLQGETLADRIASEGALPFDDVVETLAQVLSGLIAAHEKGIIHRDIKPENVFLVQRTGGGPMVKLLDFGISKVAGGDDELRLTKTGMVMGTPFYMSPEQARGDRNLDPRVDIYATGVMMYECLTGRRPFSAPNYNALLVQILTTHPRPPHEIRPAIAPGFEALCLRAMHRSRDKRFQTAADMQRGLLALRDPARRVQSVPPEPMPLVAARAPTPIKNEPSPGGTELPSVSIDLDGNDLLDSDARKAKTPGSHEVPAAAAQKPIYRPDPALSARSPTAPPRPSPSVPRPVAARPAPKRSSTPPPPMQTKRGPTPPLPRLLTPTPMPVNPRMLRGEDSATEGDPTVVGSVPPIDADSTERIPPERIAKMHPRGKKPLKDEATIVDPNPPQPEEDDAPTTLWDRKAIRKRMAVQPQEPPPRNPPRNPRR